MHSLSFSKASSSLPIFFLLLALIFHQSQNLTEADESLIREECQNADVPAVCVKYVESDPRSKTVDRVGIAAIIIDNLDNLARTLAVNIKSFASTVEDPITKPEIEGCARAYISVKSTDLPKAMEELKRGKYDQAESWISKALHQCYVSCPRANFPDEVKYDIHVYEDLTNAAQRIIERF